MTRAGGRLRIRSLMPIYEENYRLLRALVPAIGRETAPVTFLLGRSPRIAITIRDRAPYTSTASLVHAFDIGDGRWVRNMEMELRIYHDARLIEVLAYQGHGRFAPIYRFPNRRMLGPLEKQQVNVFFGEWLRSRQWSRQPALQD